MSFKIGEKVELISGGPEMTVNSEVGNNQKLECIWFPTPDSHVPATYWFHVETLKTVKPMR